MSSWKSMPCFFSPKSITHEVCGTELKFYPVSASILFQLSVFKGPISKAVKLLMGKADPVSASRQFNSDNKTEGTTDFQSSQDAMSVEMADFKSKEREEIVTSLIDSLTNKNSVELLGSTIMSSLKDDFPKDMDDRPDGTTFINNLGLPNLTALVVGVVKANEQVFGPLSQAFQTKVTSVVESINQDASLEKKSQAEENQEPSNEKSEQTDSPETPGTN